MCLPLTDQGDRQVITLIQLLQGPGNTNSSPHACEVKSLPTDESPLSFVVILRQASCCYDDLQCAVQPSPESPGMMGLYGYLPLWLPLPLARQLNSRKRGSILNAPG